MHYGGSSSSASSDDDRGHHHVHTSTPKARRSTKASHNSSGATATAANTVSTAPVIRSISIVAAPTSSTTTAATTSSPRAAKSRGGVRGNGAESDSDSTNSSLANMAAMRVTPTGLGNSARLSSTQKVPRAKPSSGSDVEEHTAKPSLGTPVSRSITIKSVPATQLEDTPSNSRRKSSSDESNSDDYIVKPASHHHRHHHHPTEKMAMTNDTEGQTDTSTHKTPMTSAELALERSGITSTFDPSSASTTALTTTQPFMPPVSTSENPYITMPGVYLVNGLIPIDKMTKFAHTPISRLQCKVQRIKKGLGAYPCYLMFVQDTNQFLLSARKRKRSKSSNYLISTDPADLARLSGKYVGKVRSNFMGTEFNVYDSGDNPKHHTSSPRSELAAITYGLNPLGVGGPRRLSVLIPKLNEHGQMVENTPLTRHTTLFQKFKDGAIDNMKILQNKLPHWDEAKQQFTLDFQGRVSLPSVRNFQLTEAQSIDDPTAAPPVLLQFGRVAKHTFTLDFQYPLTPCQALGIALTAFDLKWAVE
ncbi:tubby protein-like [Pelomyxa schiedti]|nr:tubby protein-like [Pelomyxa schiedti]